MFEFIAIGSWKIVLGLMSLILFIYWYLTKNHNYWSKQGISGPKPIFLFGTLLDQMKNSQAIIDVQYMKKYGKVYGLFNGTAPVLQICDPELIKQICVKDFHRFNNRRSLKTEHPIINKSLFFSRSEDWKRIRTITSSTFTSGKLKKLYGLVRECIQEYLVYLEEMVKKENNFNIKEIYENLTMDVIACCAFATKTNAMKDPKNPFVVNGRKIFDIKVYQIIPAMIFPKFLNRFLNITTFSDPGANDWIIKLTKHIIEKRRLSGQKNNDFIQLLIDAKADDHKREDIKEGLESHFINDEFGINEQNKNYINKTLTEDEIIGQCWIFLLAGYESSAITLSCLSHSLAMNPKCQQKLYKEVVSAMGSEKEISFEDLHRLPYLDACVSETLRLYPPATRLEREVNQDFNLDNIKLYRGQLVEIPIYAVHHSENYFENADQFIPERFLLENRKQIIPYTYLPFGAGPRNCIGMRFGLMDIKLAMAHIILRFRFTKCSKTEEEVKFRAITPVLSPLNLMVGIENRNTV